MKRHGRLRFAPKLDVLKGVKRKLSTAAMDVTALQDTWQKRFASGKDSITPVALFRAIFNSLGIRLCAT